MVVAGEEAINYCKGGRGGVVSVTLVGSGPDCRRRRREGGEEEDARRRRRMVEEEGGNGGVGSCVRVATEEEEVAVLGAHLSTERRSPTLRPQQQQQHTHLQQQQQELYLRVSYCTKGTNNMLWVYTE